MSKKVWVTGETITADALNSTAGYGVSKDELANETVTFSDMEGMYGGNLQNLSFPSMESFGSLEEFNEYISSLSITVDGTEYTGFSYSADDDFIYKGDDFSDPNFIAFIPSNVPPMIAVGSGVAGVGDHTVKIEANSVSYSDEFSKAVSKVVGSKPLYLNCKFDFVGDTDTRSWRIVEDVSVGDLASAPFVVVKIQNNPMYMTEIFTSQGQIRFRCISTFTITASGAINTDVNGAQVRIRDFQFDSSLNRWVPII